MRFISFVVAIYLLNMPVAFAVQSCNTNLQCRGTWVCIGGTAANDQSKYTGVCHPNIVMRQVCTIYNLATGVFGKGMTLLAMAAFGGRFMVTGFDSQHGVKWSELLAMIFGVAFIFGAPTFINLITRSNGTFCNFGGA